MSLFEYLSAGYSIVLAFAVSRGLNGVRSAFMKDRRYWPHAIFLFTKLFNAVAFWWWGWKYNQYGDHWNLLSFLLITIVPIVLYLQLDSLVTHHPREITDWKTHYYSERRWFFGLNIFIAILAFYHMAFIGHPEPANLIGVLWVSIVLIFSIVGFRSEQHNTHMVIAIVAWVLQLLFLGVNFQVPNPI